MPYPLNNYTTTDDYAPAGEVIFSPPRPRCALVVTNAAVFYQVAPAVPGHAIGASYLPEVFAIPGRYAFDESDFLPSGRIALMNIRSAVAGVPAQASVV